MKGLTKESIEATLKSLLDFYGSVPTFDKQQKAAATIKEILRGFNGMEFFNMDFWVSEIKSILDGTNLDRWWYHD